MTRLLVLSDLHLEMSEWEWPSAFPEHDVAVFAGDVDRPLSRSLSVLGEAVAKGPLSGSEAILVAGNHEFYLAHMDVEISTAHVKGWPRGVHFLDASSVVIKGVRFLGASLWTDYALDGDPRRGMAFAAGSMNDHRLIHKEGRIFSPADALALHGEHLSWLGTELEKPFDGPTVVVTHHGPSRRSVHPKYATSSINSAFTSNLDGFVEASGAVLWVHGHTHDSHDYRIGRTRVLCNPKGYGPRRGEGIENASFDPFLVVEV